jgi:hypothetical protein
MATNCPTPIEVSDEVKSLTYKVRPKVLQNFRANAKIEEGVLVHLRIFVRKKAVIVPVMGLLEVSTLIISMT